MRGVMLTFDDFVIGMEQFGTPHRLPPSVTGFFNTKGHRMSAHMTG